ncbi:hypothetical protein L484_010579 [Morus notabilis]|uniref:rRNA biogenesis protein RRP36 n=1 Tax=Morus notabilis TaxID=981085 RepID=W9SB93_9ROSA|nr:hypothetical protein L484_010579 [Morus notabilis]
MKKNPRSKIETPTELELSDSEEEPESSSSSEEEEEDEIERELADVTFEELQKARSNGSHSIYRKDNKEKKTGRANKNRPMEVSCKKPVSRFREVIQVPKKELRKQMKKTSDPKVIAELKNRISWIDKQLKSDSTKRKDDAILAKHKKKEREAAKQGKQPFYLKKSEIKKRRNIEKYHELKAAGNGKLESYIEKRRRKNAAKDHRHMPYRRSNDNEE